MTIFDLRCDRCGSALVGPAAGREETGTGRGVRFTYDPGDPALSDNSSMVCTDCWSEMTAWLGAEPSGTRCSVCKSPISASLHIFTGSAAWRLCPNHAVEFLNSLRTVTPKLDSEAFVLPAQPRDG